MPFRRRPEEPRDLRALLDTELRERIEEAVDSVSLEVLVQLRRAQGRAAPAADSTHDRDDFYAGVRVFLERLGGEIRAAVTPELARKADESAAHAGEDPLGQLVAAQLALAKELPDYWQRFDAIRTAWTAEQVGSGGERRGLLGRLFGP